MPDFSSAMILVAHPDDADFMCGGTVGAWARRGCDVHYVLVTDGSAGSNEPGATREKMREIRAREQEAAAAVLGVKSVTILGELDGMLEVNLTTRRKVCREVRRLRPEVLVAPDPAMLYAGGRYVNHSDHKAAGTLALSAVMPDAPTRPMFPELEEEGLEPYSVPNLWLSSFDADTYVDITDTIDLKLEALSKHESQGTGEAAKFVRERAEQMGKEAGYAYAEGFKALRFVDDD
jgi:LmbE family N-acetylglucosaminyl deacetylase